MKCCEPLSILFYAPNTIYYINYNELDKNDLDKTVFGEILHSA